ncbi:MAG: DUF4926 domain-containing protein [Capsulimonadaceae bacterium]|nr:DUF4926 domain-containing protein [Capsulimonadaceae bacterium]
MKVTEHERVVLTADLSELALRAGDVGTVVFVYDDGKAYEVEFMLLDGTTAAVTTVRADQLRPISHGDITHARPLAEAA